MAFVLYIKELPEDTSAQEFTCTPEDFALNYPEIESVAEISVKANVTKNGDQVIFKGSLSHPAKLSCSRCTDEFNRTIKSDLVFVLKFVPEADAELLDEEESDDFCFLPEGTVEYDFTTLVRERIILEVDLKPLCRPECRGICASCGKNLNIDDCNCSSDKSDERWLPLKDLIDRRK